ncbi:hypothetical protein [Nostoc sp. WHI]|uniref:hypothetical protein n=1 Tax=Nostoc sp. WHI TaxID=2650611 RepID=UPI0018C81CDA|nr:hypothetical protein [Nostoc sp. WHI]MBG1270298.1 hypothetical protein [Nostoc sp. WHI]
MNKLFLGDVFNHIFKSNFSISEDEVFETYNNPDLIQELKIGVQLFIKELNNEEHKSNLLLCVQDKGNYNLFAFSYWIPKELVVSFTEPLSILQEFVVTFGSRIKVGYAEDFFVSETTVALESRLKHPYQVIQVLGSKHIPCEYYLFFDKEFVVSDTLVFLDVYYAFCINNNKYIRWLHKLPEVEIKVPKQWAKHLSELIEVLEPNGKTQLRVLKSSNGNCVDQTPAQEDFIEVSVPEKYKHQFNHISKILTSLKSNEKVVVIPSFNAPKCIFCGSTDVSKEHIFPKWLKPFFDKSIFDSTLHISANDTEDLLDFLRSGVEGHKESSHGYTTQMVCKQCNNTWMSNLENKAKSILVDNNGRLTDSLTHINKNDAYIISIWILKTQQFSF